MAFYRSRGLVTEDLLNCDRVAEQKFRRGQLQQKAVEETQEDPQPNQNETHCRLHNRYHKRTGNKNISCSHQVSSKATHQPLNHRKSLGKFYYN